MFDIQVAKSVVSESYFQVLRHCDKPDLLQHFIERWLEILKNYSGIPAFIAFESRVPLLNQIVPHAVGLLVVSFDNDVRRLDDISVIPLYPFRVKLQYNNICCREGIEMIHLYLQLTGIRYVGFHYKVREFANRPMRELSSTFPDVTVYGPDSYKTFLEKCRQIKAKTC